MFFFEDDIRELEADQPALMVLSEQISGAVDQLHPFELQVAQIAELAGSLVINSDESAGRATSIQAITQKLAGNIEAKKKDLTRDANEYIKAVGNMAARLTAPLKEAKSSLKTKLSQWQTAQQVEAERKARQEKEALAKMQETLNKKAADLGVEAPVLPAAVEVKPAAPIRTEYGTTYIKKSWTYEVEDITKVPSAYLTINDAVVRQSIKGGVRGIPGLHIYEKETPVTRAN